MRSCSAVLAIFVIVACIRLVAGATVQHVGSGGKVILTPGANSNRWAMIALSGLEEVYSTGASIGWSTPALSSQTFTWSPASTVLLGGVNATEVTLTANLTVSGSAGGTSQGSVQLQITTHTVQQSTTVQFANQTISVPVDTVKYTVKISDWPWQDPTHYLRLGVVASSRSTGIPTVSSDGTRVSLPDNCLIQTVPDGLVDGSTATPVSTVVRYMGTSYEVQWLFPYFASSIEYDPILSIGAASHSLSQTSSWMSIFAIIGMVLIAI